MNEQKNLTDGELRAIERRLNAGEVPNSEAVETDQIWNTLLESDIQNDGLSRAAFDDLQREFLSIGVPAPDPDSV